MRRYSILRLALITALLACSSIQAQEAANGPSLRKLSVPAAQAKAIATALSMQYRDAPSIKIASDVRNEQVIVMAPESQQNAIAKEISALLVSHQQAAAKSRTPLTLGLTYITWREFEDDLQRLAGGPLPITTSRNGERAAFQLTASPMQGTTVEVDRRNNTVTVIAPKPANPAWKELISSLDQASTATDVMELLRLKNAEPAPIQRALRLLKELEKKGQGEVVAAPVGENSPFRNAVFQQPQGEAAGTVAPPTAEVPLDGGVDEDGGAGVIGDTQIQFVPELGTIIIRGAKRDVERVMEVIRQIEEQSEVTKPDVEVVELQHADANAVAALLQQLYEDVLSARQGEVSITSLDTPNALLLIGRTEAINGLRELIGKIDQPVAESSRLRVFRLQNASATDAEVTVRDFFTDRPGTGDDIRPSVGARVRVLADYRTNSLIVSAAPRDMIEVTRLINDLDVEQTSAQNQIKIFPLSHAIAEDLAPVLQEAINGEGDGGGNDNLTAPSTTLSIVTVDADANQVIDSGILAGAVVTADAGANSIVVRAPATSMSLIAELIRQLDKAPGIDSLVKVFTIEHGDALQLTTALQGLFGEDAGTQGTSVGAQNLPPATAATESSLVPLRFTADQRTNSIIASGGADDLDVVESILLRLDGAGFADRITEVIWLRHQAAIDVATAIQQYVQQRTQSVNTIQQYQQGLGPYDLPDRDLIVVAEPVSNSVLLSVSPRMYEDVRRMIDQLDRRPPMVLIKVMIAEVRLDDAFEIGGEFGLQDSLLFDRGVAAGAFPGATDPSNPGFNFNGNGLQEFATDGNGNTTPLGNAFGQGNVATRGVTSFGLGQINSNLGYGGFVLSAASDSVSLLLRTLQDAERLQILSRPQIMTMDNTEGFVQVGRLIARVTDVINNGVAGTQVVTEDIEVGLIMNVRPRVGSDGLIIMDVDATRSDRDDNNGTIVPTGGLGEDNFVVINDILRTTAQSVVAAYSGQTVIFGGLIQKIRANRSRRVPFVADIPIIGHMFKYDQEAEERSELLVFLTPMLVTGEEDLDYVKQTESSRMSWCLADVVEAHGDVGMSGGYGLWGPAVGQTIYPDLQPTIDDQGNAVFTGNTAFPGGTNPHSDALHRPGIVFPQDAYQQPGAVPYGGTYPQEVQVESSGSILYDTEPSGAMMQTVPQMAPANGQPVPSNVQPVPPPAYPPASPANQPNSFVPPATQGIPNGSQAIPQARLQPSGPRPNGVQQLAFPGAAPQPAQRVSWLEAVSKAQGEQQPKANAKSAPTRANLLPNRGTTPKALPQRLGSNNQMLTDD